jgi:transglutaminase-like putative cysteine protease
MLIRIGYDLVFDVHAPTPMLLMLYVHPDEQYRLQQPERLVVEPAGVPVRDYLDAFGNRCGRILAPAGKFRLTYDNLAWDSGEPEPSIEGKVMHRVEELPDDVVQFLLASRYCEVDRMSEMAWDLFGKTPPTWERVKAIVDWAHERIAFGYQYASPTKTAYEACEQRQGVCRDYMHLAITLLRAMNVPARYATGYLGDIGVPPVPSPMDFSAYLEVFLGGRWWAMDARHNVRRIGRICQGRGRDAVDVALTTSFGPTKLEKFMVWTDEVKEPVQHQQHQQHHPVEVVRAVG